MPDHSIIFSAPMVRALLAGTKTHTRRLAWKEPSEDALEHARQTGGGIPHVVTGRATPWQRVQPGERLWVREAVWLPPHRDEISESDLRCGADTWEPSYHADGLDPYVEDYCRWGWKSRPSIHMPRWASRITLHVEAVRVERLQVMDNNDALAEGTPDIRTMENGWDLRQCFAHLWNTLHGPGAWEANPEVVVLQFRVERRNIDA